jgi:hypothetical protein
MAAIGMARSNGTWWRNTSPVEVIGLYKSLAR